jgi:hypothetical protein
MNLLQYAQDYGLKPKKVASTRGGEYLSACPSCNNPKRFKIHPNHEGGVYHCHSCGKGGDTIQFLRDFMGKGFKEAADMVGKALEDRPHRHRYKSPEETAPMMEAEEKIFPEERWRREAAAGVDAAHEALLSDPARLEWLAGRGLDLEAVERFKLGWIEKEKFYGLKRWGLPIETNERGREKKVWLPRGYLIPQWDLAGKLTMLQVRMDKLLPAYDMRYYPIKGGTTTPMVIPPEPSLPPERTAWVIVESRLDALLIARHVGDLVGVMAQGNNSANPCRSAIHLLDASPRILNALDYDEAGEKSFEKWARRFKTARRWPVPEGKDPGEYFEEHHGDIREWILAGLPPGLKIKRKATDIPSPSTTVANPTQKEKELPYRHFDTECGREIYVTGDRATYRKLEDEGKITFSPHEIARVKAFKNDGGNPADILDILEVFGGGRIAERIEL